MVEGVCEIILGEESSNKIFDKSLQNIHTLSIMIEKPIKPDIIYAITNQLTRLFFSKPHSKIILKNVKIISSYYADFTYTAVCMMVEAVGLFKTRISLIVSENLYSYKLFQTNTIDYGYISSLTMITRNTNRTIGQCFSVNALVESRVVRIYLKIKEKIIVPRDHITIAKMLTNGEKVDLSEMKQLAPNHCHALRVNRDLVNNFHNICVLMYNVCIKMHKLPKDMMRYILAELHPTNWLVTDMSSKDRLTTKSSTWSKKICKLYTEQKTIDANIASGLFLFNKAQEDYARAQMVVRRHKTMLIPRYDQLKTERIKRKLDIDEKIKILINKKIKK